MKRLHNMTVGTSWKMHDCRLKPLSIVPTLPVCNIPFCLLPTAFGHSGCIILLPQLQGLPRKDKRAQKRADKDANNDIPVKVHRQQHDEIRHGKLQHVQRRPHRLLDQRRPHRRVLHLARLAGWPGECGLQTTTTGAVVGVRGGGRCGGGLGGFGRQDEVLRAETRAADNEGVVFAADAPEELQTEDEANDADAGAGEHPARGDVPGFGEEAGVYGVPVPKHGNLAAGHMHPSHVHVHPRMRSTGTHGGFGGRGHVHGHCMH